MSKFRSDGRELASKTGFGEESRGVGSSALPHSGGFFGQSADALIWRYGIALFFVAIALVSTLHLQRLFPYPFFFLFFAAVMASAWYGGPGPGLLAVLVSTLAVDYFLVPPFDSFAVNTTEGTYFIAFIVSALAASWVSSLKKKSEEALRDARDQLEIRVAKRTAELQRSNAELSASERSLRLLTEVIPQQIWSATPDGSIDYCNQRLLDYAGRAMQEMHGARFLETLSAEDRDRFHRSWQSALSAGTPLEGEWRVRGADGAYRHFYTRAVPLRDVQGKIVRWYGTNTDIEDHKNAEHTLLRAQAELAHLTRAVTMGELTSSIAHEVNQPLTAVVANGHACLGWLEGKRPNLPEARQAVERIIKDGTRAGTVIGRIRSLFKKEAATRDRLDVNEVIQELTVFLRDAAIDQRVLLETDLDPNLPKIVGDRVQLQQVVLNLMMNAMDAMRGNSDGPKRLLVSSSCRHGKEILIRVEDCGVGLSSEAIEKIFHSFFTTKPEGIGMGLSISRSIVESHEGRLWAEPRPSGGAIFQFTVPIAP
jgi:PAS domain S-box-containing protein